MPRSQRRRLIREGRNSGDPRTALRFAAIAKLGERMTVRQVAEHLAVVPSTVAASAMRFRVHGIDGLYDGRRNNGHQKVTASYLRRLRKILGKSPPDYGWQRPTWTRELLCRQMIEEGFPEISVGSMGLALRQIGARLGRPKPVVGCPWSKRARQARLKQLQRIARRCRPGEPVFYADEVDIHLNPKIGPDWMLPATQRTVMTPGKNQKTYIAGAVHARTRRVTYVEGTSKSSDLFCRLLWRLLSDYRGVRCIHLIVDNYNIHSSKKTQRVLNQLGDRVKLHFLPPYCPDANKIERFWRDLHTNVTRNHRCNSMEDLMDNVRSFIHDHNELTVPAKRRKVA